MRMKTALKLTIVNAWLSLKYAVKSSVGKIGWLILIVLPYVMMFLGGSEALRRGNVSIGGEIIIPIIAVPLAAFLISLNNKLGYGNEIPLPEARFTEVDKDGQVTIEVSRQQELILWTAEVEDWAERMGMR